MPIDTRRLPIRLAILVLILLLAFWLRVYTLNVPDLNIDESWSFVHAYGFTHATNFAAWKTLAVEPNNALHLALNGLVMVVVPDRFGVRWLSVICGVLSVALAARLTRRLVGPGAVLMAAFMASLAFMPLQLSRIGRPYALSTMLALASLVFWAERKWGYNLLAGVGLVFAHVGPSP